MWLRNTRSRLQVIRMLAVLSAVSFVAACGFTPLYGTNKHGASVDKQLRATIIADVKSRVAQGIRNRLISTMSPPGADLASRYRLEVFPFEWERDTLVRSDADVKRRIYNLRVTYKLFDLASNKGLASGTVLAVASYVRVVSEFANVRAKIDAENRAAVSAADDIKIRVAAYFAAQ